MNKNTLYFYIKKYIMQAEARQINTAIGIDLGSCYCRVALYRDDKEQVYMIPNQQGNLMTPSYIAFTSTSVLVGQAAKNQVTKNPQNTIYNFLRLIGMQWDHPKIQKIIQQTFYHLQKSPENQILIKVRHNETIEKFTPQQILTILLSKIRQSTNKNLGFECNQTVISIPIHFNLIQRKLVKISAQKAGFKVLRLTHGSSLAAFSYAYDNLELKEKHIMVCDFGGGKCDISAVTIDEGISEIKSIESLEIGGEDLSNKLLQYCVNQYQKKTGINLTSNLRGMQRLKVSIQNSKKTLTSSNNSTVQIDSLSQSDQIQIKLSRQTFYTLCEPIFKQIVSLYEKNCKDAFISKNNFYEILLIGSSSRIPKIMQLTKQFFGYIPKKLYKPEQAVATGAALYACILSGDKSQKLNQMLSIDMIPYSLGVQTSGGVMEVIVPRNATFPIKRSKQFQNFQINSSTVIIKLFQGDSALAKNNVLVEQIKLTNITVSPEGKCKISVQIEIDQNNYVTLTISDQLQNDHKEHIKILENLKYRNDINLSEIMQQKMEEQIKMKEQMKMQLKKQVRKQQLIQQKKQQLIQQMQEQSDLHSIGISKQGIQILRSNQIQRIQLLMLATEQDLIQIKLPLGDRLKIRTMRKK